MDILPGFKLCRKGLHQYPQGKRTCPECKKISNEHWKKANKDKVKKTIKDWQQNNREKQRKACKKWYQKNKKTHQQNHLKWVEKNPEKEKQYVQKWRSKNKHILNANAAKRRAAKKQAILLWANIAKIKEIYKLAEKLTAITGIEYQVDHIYPLQSKYLCGLHVETNLQILTKEENISKSNRTWPGQLDCQKD
jgi:hypothetical protein